MTDNERKVIEDLLDLDWRERYDSGITFPQIIEHIRRELIRLTVEHDVCTQAAIDEMEKAVAEDSARSEELYCEGRKSFIARGDT